MKFKSAANYLMTFLLLLILAGCSSPDSKSSKKGQETSKTTSQGQNSNKNTNTAFNSCTLLSENDIHRFFPGAKIKITKQADVPNTSIGSRVCFYELSDTDNIFIQTILYRTADMAKELQDLGRTVEANYFSNKKYAENPIEIDGLGQDAYFGGIGLKAFGGLHVLINSNTALNITVGLGHGNNDVKRHLEIEKALAQRIMERL